MTRVTSFMQLASWLPPVLIRGATTFRRSLTAILQNLVRLSLYRDLSDLDGSEDWWRQVETAIKSVEHVVPVLTPSALQSRFVRDEWKLARQEGKVVWPVSGPGELDLSHAGRCGLIATTSIFQKAATG